MKKSGIRRALISSAIALVICFAMLLGTTFAWFTDNATTAVNTIQSGKLDVQLESSAQPRSGWANAEGQQLTWKDANGGTDILWEPGCTFRTDYLRVANYGNLALKYKIVISGIDGDAKLLEAIEFSIVTIDYLDQEVPVEDINALEGTLRPTMDPAQQIHSSDPFYIQAHMKEEAGNEYQELKLEGISITVYATQYTYEFDSIDDQYDADAEYDLVSYIHNFDELKAAFANGGKYALAADVVVPEILKLNAGIGLDLDLNGKTISAADGTSSQAFDCLIDTYEGSSLTIGGNGTVDLGANRDLSFVCPRGDVTINGGTYKIDTGLSSYGAFFVGAKNRSGRLIINGGYFDGGFYEEGNCALNSLYLLNLSENQYVRVYGGTFVAQNPAWGDEANGGIACEEHGTNRHKGWWVGTQGVFLEGQVWTDGRTDTDLPAGYTITKGTTTDGTNRPTYTVEYTK